MAFRRRYKRSSRSSFGGSRRVVRSAPTRVVRSTFSSRTGSYRLYPITGGIQVESPNATTTGSAVLLNNVVRGNSITERTSNRIRMLDLVIRGGFVFNPHHPNTALNTTDNNMGFWSKQQDVSLIIAYIPVSVAAMPQLSSYYQTTPGVANVDTWSLPLTTQYPTMRILYRKDYSFKVQAIAATALAAATQIVPGGTFPANSGYVVTHAPIGVRNVKIRLRCPFQTVYTDTAVAPSWGGIASGSLVMFLMGDYVAPTTGVPDLLQRPLLAFESRLNFVDLD